MIRSKAHTVFRHYHAGEILIWKGIVFLVNQTTEDLKLVKCHLFEKV